MFFGLFLGLWGSLVPFITRKSSSFSFLERAMRILGHSLVVVVLAPAISTVSLFDFGGQEVSEFKEMSPIAIFELFSCCSADGLFSGLDELLA